MKKMKKQPVIWVIRCPNGYMGRVGYFTRRDAISHWMVGVERPWSYWYQRGYRAVRARIV